MDYIVIVQFGCASEEPNICKVFKRHADAYKLFSMYADQADRGQWFERLELLTCPFPVEVVDEQAGKYVIL